VAPEEVAAIFIEPVQGEGGYIVPPDGWIQTINELCQKYGILLVDDEVQSGIGRTGKMWAIEHWGIEPDILCTAKALASGMPISAMIAKESVMTWSYGAHGSTFGGNPVAAAAALATLDVIEEEGLMENAVRVGARLKGKLEDLSEESRMLGDVRGLGLMIGVEIVKDKQSKIKAKKETDGIMLEAFKRGLMLLPCGPNSIRFSPPLNITEQQADTAYDIFAAALAVIECK
jgi:4-aminobutyrate aminotransferase